ncbi:hypothetical protein F8O07_06855 [Pseudoclavibacter sp. CFCC 13796]|uniref:hypothetical protein n=1 Tax=Pseudoclavibacter sp. CFCC 13796 TaxID=2615179 RepID=UPI0013014F48|nr:hypothetical protein [Pseudoclavibacter sp. CFCC 13796]KAB1661618.1 hypothetical protein F8O07_06855 [Pseudoclavibacter sp. CFCC 13796]
MTEHYFQGVACNSADEASLAAEIPLCHVDNPPVDSAYIAEAVIGSDWLKQHDRQLQDTAWQQGFTRGYQEAQGYHGLGDLGCEGPDSLDCDISSPYATPTETGDSI